MNGEPLKIKKRGEDGAKVITIRIRQEILCALNDISAETNISRNEIINLILKHGVDNVEIISAQPKERQAEERACSGET